MGTIIGKLREAKVGLAKGKQVAVACKQLGLTPDGFKGDSTGWSFSGTCYVD